MDILGGAPLVLRGREVLLRPLETGDAEAIAAAAEESREQYRWIPVPSGLVEARAFIERAHEMRHSARRCAFAVIWQSRLVGTTSYYDLEAFHWPAGAELARAPYPDGLEIGHTWLAASAQRTRCNSEAKYLLLRHAFEGWCVHRVRFRTDERNLRSRAAIERLGAKLDGIVRGDKAGSDGTLRNSVYFSILHEEWAEVGRALRAKLELGG